MSDKHTGQESTDNAEDFNLRRYFSIFSIVIILVLTAMLSGFVYWNQRSTLINYSISLSKTFAARMSHQVNEAFEDRHINFKDYLDRDSLKHKGLMDSIVSQYINNDTQTVKLKIFNSNRVVVYSTDDTNMGIESTSTLLQSALEGKESHKMIRRDTVNRADTSEGNAIYRMDLLEFYMPLYDKSHSLEGSKVIGALEIYRDETAIFNLMRSQFVKVPLLLVFAMGLLYLMLQIVIRKASMLIKRQHEEISNYNMELEAAHEKITESIDEVISHESFHVRIGNDNLLKCWEVKDCDNTKCPSYHSHELRCWQVAGTFCGGKVQGFFANKYGDCSKCDVFQHMNNNRITMIGESFNNMMTMLQHKHAEVEDVNRKLNHLVDIDPLTQISNRRCFQKKIDKLHLMALRYKHIYSIIISDVDNFKLYNDTYGHQQGDYVLIAIAQSMKSSLRRTDEVFRWGGEEFIVILPELNHTDALKVAENLRASVEQLDIKHEKCDSGRITLSCGVATCYPWDSADPSWDNVVRKADDALYKAKKGRKNCIYSAE